MNEGERGKKKNVFEKKEWVKGKIKTTESATINFNITQRKLVLQVFPRNLCESMMKKEKVWRLSFFLFFYGWTLLAWMNECCAWSACVQFSFCFAKCRILSRGENKLFHASCCEMKAKIIFFCYFNLCKKEIKFHAWFEFISKIAWKLHSSWFMLSQPVVENNLFG